MASLPERPRVILLGASNVTRSISTIVETAHNVVGGPMDLFAAYGHGRSLALHTRVFQRGLCGLLEAGLWKALDSSRAGGAYALLSDIGNDLLYGVPAETVARWVDQVLARCQSVARRVIVTELPMTSIARLGPRRYRAVRRIIFPSCTLALEEVIERAGQLNEAIRESAARRGAVAVAHRAAWYGFDPIHIRRGAFADAWLDILRHWREGDGDFHLARARGSLHRWIYLRRLAPEKREFFGVEHVRDQPAGKLADGSTISLY